MGESRFASLRRVAALPRELRPLYAGTVVTRLGTFVVPYLTLYLSGDRGLSLGVTGRVVAAGGAGLFAGNLAGGWLCDRIGRKPTILLALVLNAVGLAVLAGERSTATGYAGALAFASLGAGMYPPAASAWIADVTRGAQRQLAYTANYVCINVGMGLGPLLGGLLAAASYRWLFVGDIASTLVCAVLIARASGGHRRTADPEQTAPPLVLDRSTLGVLAFCCTSFFLIAPLMGMEYTVPLLVGTVLHEPLVLVGIVYTINAACILLLGLPIERRLAGRDAARMMVLAAGLWSAGLAIIAAGLSAVALLLGTVVWTVGEMIGSVVVPTYVANNVPEHARGRLLAVPDAMRSLAAVLAPIALGMVWDAHGVQWVLWILVATPLLGAALYGAGSLATNGRRTR